MNISLENGSTSDEFMLELELNRLNDNLTRIQRGLFADKKYVESIEVNMLKGIVISQNRLQLRNAIRLIYKNYLKYWNDFQYESLGEDVPLLIDALNLSIQVLSDVQRGLAVDCWYSGFRFKYCSRFVTEASIVETLKRSIQITVMPSTKKAFKMVEKYKKYLP